MQFIKSLRNGKDQLRAEHRNASLEDKLKHLICLQRIYIQIVSTRRPLKPHEVAWELE